MNKKAFTLIELLAVVVVLGVIALLIFPNVDKTINESKEKSYSRQISILEQAAKKYMKDNLNELPGDSVDSCCINIDTLINKGYIQAKDKYNGDYVVINPKTNEPLSGMIKISFNEDYNQYEYNYSENCNYLCRDFSSENYMITYELDGGRVSNNKTSYKPSDGDFTLNNPKKTGYTFFGWTGTDITEPVKEVIIKSGSTGDREYTANWQVNTYTIVYDGNGATSGQMQTNPDITYEYDKDYILMTNAFSKDGYTFKGWSKTPGGNVQYEDSSSVNNLTAEANGMVTLYAVWKDEIPPTVQLVSDFTTWSSENVTLTGTAQDNETGIVAYQFSTSDTADESNWTLIDPTNEAVSYEYEADENKVYYFYIKDNDGNVSRSSVEVLIDKTKPTIALTAVEEDTETKVDSGTWVGTNLAITLEDKTKGPSGTTIYYCVDTDNTCEPVSEYTKELTISNEETSYIRYKIISGAGLSSDVESYTANIDKTAPTITITRKKVFPQRNYFLTEFSGNTNPHFIKTVINTDDTTEGYVSAASVVSFNTLSQNGGIYNAKYLVNANLSQPNSCFYQTNTPQEGYGFCMTTGILGKYSSATTIDGEEFKQGSGEFLELYLNQVYAVKSWLFKLKYVNSSASLYFNMNRTYSKQLGVSDSLNPITNYITIGNNNDYPSTTNNIIPLMNKNDELKGFNDNSGFYTLKTPEDTDENGFFDLIFSESYSSTLDMLYSDEGGSGLKSDEDRTTSISNLTSDQTLTATDSVGNKASCTYNYTFDTCTCTSGTCVLN